ncbi:MAG: SelB C-terminal domain-containing protein, partial [Thermomicrobiales bacterium]|nr:SelB C-terminal domain-containing protein [Thermomicrobiales bacterium]
SIQPRGNEARIRGLQTFGEPVETAHPGSRVAINLSGIETDQLARGDVVVVPGSVQPAMRVDARVRILESSGRPLAHNDEVMVFAGSAETPARVALLAGEEIEAGQQGWVQLRMCAPVVVLPQDRFILRRPSPPETIGGGIVLVLDPSRHKRGDAVVLDRLELLTNGDPADRFWEWLGTRMVSKRELEQAPAGRELAEAFLAAGQAAGTVETLEMQGARVYVTQVALQAALDRVVSELSTYHVSHPLEAGAPREKIRQELGYERAIFDLLIARAVQDGIIEEIGPLMRHSGFQIRLSDSQRQRVDDFLRRVESASFQPPLPADAGLEPELVAAMIATGQVISVGDGIVFLPKQIELARGRLQSALGDHESISLAEFRDLLGTSRRYSQALLEYFDRQRLTRRVGDRRVGYRPAQDGEEQTER